MKIPVRSSQPTVGCEISLIQLACKSISAVYWVAPEKEQGMNGKKKRKEIRSMVWSLHYFLDRHVPAQRHWLIFPSLMLW